jgi:hypothetical protein
MGLITDPLHRIAAVMDGKPVYRLLKDSSNFVKLTKSHSIDDFLFPDTYYLREPLFEVDLMVAIKYALDNVPLKWQREDTMNPEIFNDLIDWNIFKNTSVKFYLTDVK